MLATAGQSRYRARALLLAHLVDVVGDLFCLLVGVEQVAKLLQRFGGVLVLRPGNLLMDLAAVLGSPAKVRLAQFDWVHRHPSFQPGLWHPRTSRTTHDPASDARIEVKRSGWAP
jgi:hypothetical protein